MSLSFDIILFVYFNEALDPYSHTDFSVGDHYIV